ncbi:MAG: asparaginase, partial [Alistipes sp.]|nr:asparaginase [Alistipes sp.]
MKRSSILIIYTGGTIGMKTDEATGALVPFDFSGIYEEFPSLKRLKVDLEVLTIKPPIDSSNVSVENWVDMARLIRDNYSKYDGFVVLHGTDTMSYSAAALSFMLENLAKPVIFIFNETGSHDSYTGNLTTQGEEESLAWFLSSTYTRTDNDIRFANGSQPEHPNAGEYESYQQALRLDWQANEDNSLTLTYRREDSEYGMSGLYDMGFAPVEYYNRYTFRTNLVTAKWQGQLTERWVSSLMAGYFGYDATLGTGYC